MNTPATRAWYADEVLRDRLPITPLRVSSERTRLRWAAWSSIATLWLIGWGSATLSAFERLATGEAPAPPSIVGMLSSTLVDLCIVIGAGLLAFRMFAPSARGWARLRCWPMLVPVAVLLGLCSFGLTALFNVVAHLETYTYPLETGQDPLRNTLQIFGIVLAGPTEELALLALVVLALRRCGYSWWTVGVVAILVRVPFHVYYGWGAIFGFGVWAILCVVVYRWCGTILPFIVGHSVSNLPGSVGALLPGWEQLHWVRQALGLIGAIAIWVFMASLKRRPKSPLQG